MHGQQNIQKKKGGFCNGVSVFTAQYELDLELWQVLIFVFKGYHKKLSYLSLAMK